MTSIGTSGLLYVDVAWHMEGLSHGVHKFLPFLSIYSQSSSLTSLLPTAEMKKIRSTAEEDLISELPDSLLHHIFSFLDMIYMVRTCVLSKRWRYIWTSVPFLNFNHNEFKQCTGLGTPAKYNDFKDFVDRVLFLRNGVTNIHSFHLSSSWDEFCFERGKVVTWIRFAVLRSVEEIDIDVSLENINLKLPYCLFTSKSLRMLKLRMCWELDPSPSASMGLPCLKSMHLECVRFVGGDGFSSLISRCPVLETLIIYQCSLTQTNNLTISALQLKTLEINMMYGGGECCKITVFAPMLTSFRCSGWSMNEYSFMNNSSLVSAYIDINYCEDDMLRIIPIWGDAHVLAEKAKRSVHIKNVIKCFQGLADVKSLVLSPQYLLLKFFAEVLIEVWNQLTPFLNLSYLELKLSLSENYSCALKYLLEKCPNVETVVLELFEAKTEKEMQQQAVTLPLYHLKHVEIHNVIGGKDELELVKCFLKNAIILKKMIVIMSGNQSSAMKKRFIDQVVTFSKGYSVELSI